MNMSARTTATARALLRPHILDAEHKYLPAIRAGDRGQETYGEDPFLTGRIGVGFIKENLQGDDTNYLKAMACAKHFAVHSGPEPESGTFFNR